MSFELDSLRWVREHAWLRDMARQQLPLRILLVMPAGHHQLWLQQRQLQAQLRPLLLAHDRAPSAQHWREASAQQRSAPQVYMQDWQKAWALMQLMWHAEPLIQQISGSSWNCHWHCQVRFQLGWHQHCRDCSWHVGAGLGPVTGSNLLQAVCLNPFYR